MQQLTRLRAGRRRDVSITRWSCSLGAAVVVMAIAASAAAQEPRELRWARLHDRAVVVEKQDGSLVAGTLVAVADGGVEVVQPDGARVVVGAANVKALRARLKGQQVTVRLKDGDEAISGKLAERDDTTIVVETDDGRRVTVVRASIETVRERFPAPPRVALPPASAAEDESHASEAPPEDAGRPPRELAARTGFQMALSTGYSLPLGSADNSLSQSDFVSGQVPVLLEIGGKTSRHLFFGVYSGVAFGGAGGALSSTCSLSGVSCSSLDLRFGAEIQVHFLPDARFNPYLGYGVGLESTSVSASSSATSASVTALGVELGRFTLGGDFRLSHYFGLGPCFTFSVAQYETISESTGGTSMSADLASKALHEWLTIGARVTLFP
jgi:small nuclear ribonucleoprotein (snRNP)-like protein